RYRPWHVVERQPFGSSAHGAMHEKGDQQGSHRRLLSARLGQSQDSVAKIELNAAFPQFLDRFHPIEIADDERDNMCRIEADRIELCPVDTVQLRLRSRRNYHCVDRRLLTEYLLDMLSRLCFALRQRINNNQNALF